MRSDVLFNSLTFIAFFVVVYAMYLLLTHRWQNALLLAASYVFYGSWDWRFLGLMLFTTTMDYGFGRLLDRLQDEPRRRLVLVISVSVNLGILFIFKYFNFFFAGLDRLLSVIGLETDVRLLHVALPLGISFYTFHNISYIVDVYTRRVEPARRFVDFGLYVALFPQLIAGPIARPAHLLPQIQRPRRISYEMLRMGGWLILLGYVKKVVLADNMAPLTARMFENPNSVHGTEVLFGLYAFAFQIYGDFSCYSDIARGLANLMGFDLALNFRRPYLAVNPADFWRRWHISLSTWLRDYLYIPLGGNRGGSTRTYRNLMMTMLLGGLWHGAAWHYVAWGLFHGVLLCLHRAVAPMLALRVMPRDRLVWRGASVVAFFHITCVGWLLFAVKGLVDVPVLLRNLAQPYFHGGMVLFTLLLFAGPLVMLELMEERAGGAVVKNWPRPWRAACYASMVAAIVLCGALDRNAFIYFQF
jgi:D-alanyl-lipoteichoic acid acyltransferase DltB (MBOAT superfamily)